MGRDFVNSRLKIACVFLFILFFLEEFIVGAALNHWGLDPETVFVGYIIEFVFTILLFYYNFLLAKRIEEWLWHLEYERNSDYYIKKWTNKEFVHYFHDNYPYEFYAELEARPELKDIVSWDFPGYFKTEPHYF